MATYKADVIAPSYPLTLRHFTPCN